MKIKHARSSYLLRLLASLGLLIFIVSLILLTYHLNVPVDKYPQATTSIGSEGEIFIGKIIKGSLNGKTIGLVLEDLDCKIISGLQLACTAVIQVNGEKLYIRYTHMTCLNSLV